MQHDHNHDDEDLHMWDYGKWWNWLLTMDDDQFHKMIHFWTAFGFNIGPGIIWAAELQRQKKAVDDANAS